MLEITLYDSNFPHQEYLTPYLKSSKIIWKRDNIRRNINVYTDNFIKKTVIDVPQDGNINVCILLEPLTNPPWTFSNYIDHNTQEYIMSKIGSVEIFAKNESDLTDSVTSVIKIK